MAVWYVRVMPHYVTMCGTTSTEYIGIETLFLFLRVLFSARSWNERQQLERKDWRMAYGLASRGEIPLCIRRKTAYKIASLAAQHTEG